jgi:hypothetical protein
VEAVDRHRFEGSKYENANTSDISLMGSTKQEYCFEPFKLNSHKKYGILDVIGLV